MLLCLSSCRRCCLQWPEELAREVAFEAADGVPLRFALAYPSRDVGDRGRVAAAAGEHDRVQRPVEPAVAAAVESLAYGSAGAGRDRRRDSWDAYYSRFGECLRAYLDDPGRISRSPREL